MYQLKPIPPEDHKFRGPPWAYTDVDEDPPPVTVPPTEAPTKATEAAEIPDGEQSDDHPTGGFQVYTVGDGVPEDVTDAEEIARILNQQRGSAASDDLGQWPGLDLPHTNGHGGEPPNGVDMPFGTGLPPGGDWTVQPPDGTPEVSQDKLSVTLPVVIHLWYDWARSTQGWRQGDGSLSAFVTDCLLDYFHRNWRYDIVFVPLSEVKRG